MSGDLARQIARLMQRVVEPAIPSEYNVPLDGHDPVEPPRPYEVGFCRIIANLQGGSYRVTEIVHDGADWQLCGDGEGFIDEIATSVEGREGGEAGDEPILYVWRRLSSGARDLVIVAAAIGSASFTEYILFCGAAGCGSLVVDDKRLVYGAYDKNAAWKGLAGADEPASTTKVYMPGSL